MGKETWNGQYLQNWIKREQWASPYTLVKSEVKTQLDSGTGDECTKTGKSVRLQKRGRNVVEGSLKANEMFFSFLLGACSFLCFLMSRNFIKSLQFWEGKARWWVYLPLITAWVLDLTRDVSYLGTFRYKICNKPNADLSSSFRTLTENSVFIFSIGNHL